MVVALVMCAGGTRAAESTDLRTIVEQVRERQARVRKVHCKWTGRELHPAGSCPVRDESGEWVEGGGPATDTTQDQSLSLVIDGDDLRVDVRGTLWSASRAQFAPFQWSGHLADGVWRHHGSGGGSVDQLAEVHMLYSLFYEPVPMAYRLFDPAFPMADPDRTSVAGTTEYDGHSCVVLRMKEPAADGDDIVWEWWMAEDMDWVPVRYQMGRESGRLIREAALSYEADEDVGWRLASWQVDQPAAGGLYITAVDVRTTFNEAVATGPLEVEFPVGTAVYDGVRGVEYIVGQEAETMKALDGMLAGGAMAEFVEEVKNETGARPPGTRSDPAASVSPWLAVAVAVALAIAAVPLLIGNRKHTA